MAIPNFPPAVYVPTFEMKVGSQPLGPLIARRIMQVSVTERADPPNHFSFQLYDPQLELVKATSGPFTEGAHVEISIGYLGNTRKMITGSISALTVDFPSSGPPTIQVDGFDSLHNLTRGTSHRHFAGPTPDSGPPDSQIVAEIAAEMGLTPSVDETKLRKRPRVQNHTTNFAFLEELARANGYSLWVEDGTLFFKSTRPAPEIIKLERGKTLLSFSPRLSTAGQVRTVEVRGWDPIQKQSFAARAPQGAKTRSELSLTGQQQIEKGTGGQSEMVIENAPVTSAEEAQQLADAIYDHQLQTTVTGSGSSVGHPEIHVGTILDLSGLGRFDGQYTVTEATHTVSDSGYQTSFQVNSSAALSGLFASPGDLSSAFSGSDRGQGHGMGVRIGLVAENKDPEGLGRVKVKFPGSSESDTGRWARLAVLMAGAERGVFFLPEINDEVLVAFEYGDLARPYVLGALWNGKDHPPETNADGKNNLRLIKSRSGHLVRLDDTDGQEKIEIIDKSGKNRLTFDTAKNTISIQAAKDVSIEAKQGTIKLSAQTIELASSAETKIQAQGGATLDGSPGNTIIKGTTVNLN